MNDLFGTDTLFDPEDFTKLFCRLGLDLAFASIVILYVYYRRYRNRELVFVYFVFNVITFSLCILLRKTPMDMGFALGLFAIFGILRYRTEQIAIRDLTYLFIVLGLAILNGVANKKVSLSELIAVNATITGIVVVLDGIASRRHVAMTPVLYDKLELLHPSSRAALHADVTARTGLTIVRVKIDRIDLLKDAAELSVFHLDG